MSNIQTGAERMPQDLAHLGFLAGEIGRLITISTTPVIAGDSFEMRSEERFSRNAETDLVCRLLLEKKNTRVPTTRRWRRGGAWRPDSSTRRAAGPTSRSWRARTPTTG